MAEEPEQNSQISSKAEQQAKPPTSTNAGVVVAWIGIVLCGISLGLFVASICVWLIAALVNPDDAIPYFLKAVGYFFQGCVPYVGLQYMRLIKHLAKTGKWTSGACIVAVIAIYLLANLLVILIGQLEIFIGSLPFDELGLWDISFMNSIATIYVNLCAVPLLGFIVLLITAGLLSFLIVAGLTYLVLYICGRYDYVEIDFLIDSISTFPYFRFF